MEQSKWIGLAHVFPLDSDVLGPASGAYVNVVGFAKDKLSFRKKVKLELAKIGLQLKRLEAAEPFNNRLSKFRLGEEILELSNRIESGESAVAFSKFHTYP
jgi:hypothetical protein